MTMEPKTRKTEKRRTERKRQPLLRNRSKRKEEIRPSTNL
jgi:hypothetical protein